MASAPVPRCRGCGQKFTTRRKKNETGYCGKCIHEGNYPESEYCGAPLKSAIGTCRRLGIERHGGRCATHRNSD